MKKLKRGDEVIVRTGRSRGQRGKVLRLLDDGRVVVEGVNMIKRHTRPNPQANQPGGILEKEAPIAAANVALYNPATKKPDRVGIRVLADGRKVRYFKSNGEVVDV
ncbi:MAG TPA: 50S ribosomal protein L24 [Gammaproteobacteria bacterium]|nr:50S ribosomal protein L24 [Gammaproteobacteria bacterium]